jgi:threonine-phosphate decarboxylase
LTAAPGNPGLVVFSSLTKLFAIPGLRLAFLTAHPELIKKFKQSAEPWAINSLALAAGEHCLDQGDFVKRTPLESLRLREVICSILKPFGRIFPSDVNYILIKSFNQDYNSLIDYLFQKGILVRDASNMPGLGPGFIRLAVRPPSEITRLKAALDEYRA